MLRSLLFTFALVTLTVNAAESRTNFTPDRGTARSASQHANDMVQFAAAELNLKLDWSDSSIEEIEALASQLHGDYRREHASFGDIERLVQMLGSYVGEVFRRNHGGDWGTVAARGKRIVAMKPEHGGAVFWPIERIKQRIRAGAANNVWAYYQARTALTDPIRDR